MRCVRVIAKSIYRYEAVFLLRTCMLSLLAILKLMLPDNKF